MKIQKIIILLIVLSMLLINVTSVFAIEVEKNIVQSNDVDQVAVDTNDEASTASIATTDILAQSKTHTGMYEGNNLKIQTDKFATYYFSNLKTNFGNNTLVLVDMLQLQ